MAELNFQERPLPDGVAGLIMALAPLPFIFVVNGDLVDKLFSWPMLLATLSAVCCLLCGLLLTSYPRLAKVFGALAAVAFFMAALPHMAHNPFAALFGGITMVGAGFALLDIKDHSATPHQLRSELLLLQARWSQITVIVVVGAVAIIANPNQLLNSGVIALSVVIAQLLCVRWVLGQSRVHASRPHGWRYLLLPAVTTVALSALFLLRWQQDISAAALFFSALTFLLLPRPGYDELGSQHWWDMLLDHPARVLFSTFFILSVVGTMGLKLPLTTTGGSINIVDAAFTSVSAVCVTGLTVLDTGIDFSGPGQLLILVLIQLGGLGIMGLTTVALHVMGKRISLQQERVLSSMTDTGQHDLIGSLIIILKVTFCAEMLGAIILTLLFVRCGDSWGAALWRGVFTAISAFCNAGFALQSDSLISYGRQPLILHTVAALIVVGGIAPATTLIIPRWLRRQRVPLPARLALGTTVIMLVAGTLCILAFEWNGMLAGFDFADKINNAWFQSVTLRTAGFNSVAISQVASPAFLLMLSFMFIGGSPGGTAGGIKTTTIAVLALTFWTNITNRHEVIVHNRRIHPSTIYRAITIVAAGVAVWTIIVLMLETTQQIPARDLIFEATSAMGTVGLSTGATGQLDAVGKIIIIIAMFVGRIGPMTLFMLLNDDHTASVARCPDAKISLT